jgi:nucleolar protein 15
MPKAEKKESVFKVPDKPVRGILKKRSDAHEKESNKGAQSQAVAKSVEGKSKVDKNRNPKPISSKAGKSKTEAVQKPQTKELQNGKKKGEEKESEQQKKKKKEKEEGEESSSSSFNFEEESESHSDSASRSSVSTSEISSSITDDFKKQKLEIALDDETTKKLTETLEKKKKDVMEIKTSDPRGVIYLGHLPFGFFEAQMKAFFAQFGIVTRIKLSRNKKTGKSKHYAFVEFLDPIVAEIVADTMDGYMMYHRVLKCKLVPPEKIHPKMFHGANRKFVPKPTQEIHKKNVNKRKTPEERQKTIEKLLEKEKVKREKLAALGVDYDFPGYEAEVEKEKKRKVSEAPVENTRPQKKAKK